MKDHRFIKKIENCITEQYIYALMILTEDGRLGYYCGFFGYTSAKLLFRKNMYTIEACYSTSSPFWRDYNLDRYFPDHLYPNKSK